MTGRAKKVTALGRLLWFGILAVFLNTAANATSNFHFFEVSEGIDPAQSFVIALSDPKKIDMARAIVSGSTTEPVHVSGRIVKSRVRYNSKWAFHLDPKSITFITFAPTTCARGMSTHDVQMNLGLVGKPGSPLAAGYWCPLGSSVKAELARRRR
jgi:hypothetical protein